MPGDGSPHRKESRKLTLVLIPGDESEKTRTLALGRARITLLAGIVLAVVVASVLLVLTLTPIGSWLSIGQPELEEEYKGRVYEIQAQVNSLMEEMIVLRSYNLRLRRALGEQVRAEDTQGLPLPGERAGSVQAPAPETTGTMKEVGVSTQLGSGTEDPLPPAKMTTAAILRPEPRSPAITFPLVLPASGFIARRMDEAQGHLGIDFAGKSGSSVLASAEGKVIFADWTYDFGFTMILSHGDGYSTVYKHNRSLLKGVGTPVRRGEVIALLGSTGQTSSGPHLHFEVWKDGDARNPENYLVNLQ